MDAVITYVNGLDPVWQKSYIEYTGAVEKIKRFRDWGTLKYLLRGIQTHMPFIDNVYLVVACESQVPSWADTSRLKIVCHRDIIPADLLPLFNSGSIELFLHRIEGLSEQFLYFNDDFFPVGDMQASDFFCGDKLVMGFARQFTATNMYKQHCRTSERLARKAAGVSAPFWYMRPQHITAPMLRSASYELFEKIGDDLISSVSRVRTRTNTNQYVFADYCLFTGRAVKRRMSAKHMSLGRYSAKDVAAFLAEPARKFVCINDVEMGQEKFEAMGSEIRAAFEKKFPSKSRFEL